MPRPHPTSHRTRRQIVGALALAVLFTAAPSCGDDTDAARSVPTVTADPTDVADTDAFDFSNTVEIRDGAVAPAQAVATVENDVVIKNTTVTEQTVRATNGTFGDTGPAESTIPPGGDFSFRQTTPISITYEVVSQPGVTGRIQVDPGLDTI